MMSGEHAAAMFSARAAAAAATKLLCEMNSSKAALCF